MNNEVDRSVIELVRPAKRDRPDPMAQRMQQAADNMCEITASGEVIIHKTVAQLDSITHSPHTDPNIRAVARLVLEIARHRERIRTLEKQRGQNPQQ